MRKITILLVCCWFFAFPAYATTTENSIYTAEVPVISQSAVEQDRAFPKALEEVLIKVSGNRAVLSNPSIQESLPQVRNTVRAYHYLNSPTDSASLLLRVQFDPKAVKALLKKAQLSILSKERPVTLLWLAQTMGQETTLIGNTTTGGLPELIQSQAHRRGLPVVLPALDLDDLNHLSTKEVLSFEKPAIDKASERYHCEGVWVGHLFSQGDHWVAKWTFWRNQTTLSGETIGKNPSQVIADSLDKLADDVGAELKQPHEFSENNANQIFIEVNNLDSMDAYAKVLVYLRGLSPVKKVSVAKVDSSKVTFALRLNTDQHTLQKIIALDTMLLPINSSGDELQYQWAS